MNDQILIQILRWLMQPKVWRFVGFASAVVGLLCYALSSSFNHLFGKWTFLKIFLYSVFSLIISLMILYAKTWQHSRSLHFKAHMAFLVLTITSIYSFFSDKVMKGKPDVYSLISPAAFAIMSLSLSRQSQCGFEVDFMYFFLGCLIVQLLKIKLQLAIIGVGFSYCLVILRSSFPSRENEYAGPRDEHQVVIEVDSLQLGSISIAVMMQQLESCVNELQQENLYVMKMLSERAKKYLEGKARVAELLRDDNFLLDALLAGRVNELSRIVKLMVGAGYEKECSQVYISWRRDFLQLCLMNKLFRLGENEPKSTQLADKMIGRWVKASVITVKILFPSERRLIDGVFAEFSSNADECFKEACCGVVFHLVNFAYAFVNRSPSAWRLFKILHMFKTLQDLIPEFQSLFPSSVVNEVVTVKNRLGEASRDLFMELDKLIFRTPEAKRAAAADGGHHEMAVWVMSWLSNACLSWRTQEQILQESTNGAGASPFRVQMKRIIKLLERKLVEKSKIYEDPALSCIFMINNRTHMEAVSEGWEMEKILGEDWFQKNREQVHKNLELYQKRSWNKALDLLKLDGYESVDVAAESMKEKLNLFNICFEEMSRVQSTWFFYDKKLREQIITSLENVLLPAYGIFIRRFQDVIGKHAYEYIVYGMFDIQNQLNNLFDGGKKNQRLINHLFSWKQNELFVLY